jgi:hypothetical protein
VARRADSMPVWKADRPPLPVPVAWPDVAGRRQDFMSVEPRLDGSIEA